MCGGGPSLDGADGRVVGAVHAYRLGTFVVLLEFEGDADVVSLCKEWG